MSKIFFSFVALAMVFIGNMDLSAQEELPELPIKSSGAIVVRAANSGPDGEVVVGQTIIAGSPGEGSMQFFATPTLGMFGAPNMENMLRDNQIQQELGLVEEQMKEIKSIQEAFSRQMQEQSQSLFIDGKFDATRARELGEKMQTVQATMKKKIDGVLLPHQQQRLMQNRPGGQAIFQGRIAEELELTDEQKEELEERAEEIEKELEKDIAELKKKAREDLLKGLTAKQREKLDSMLGEEFQYTAPKPGRPMRRRGASSIQLSSPGQK